MVRSSASAVGVLQFSNDEKGHGPAAPPAGGVRFVHCSAIAVPGPRVGDGSPQVTRLAAAMRRRGGMRWAAAA